MTPRRILACLALLPALCATGRWGIYEITLPGPSAGNPFIDVRLSASFQFRHRTVEADGFYDGSGTYRIRFMPDELGQWTYTTSSNIPSLDGKTGAFSVTAPAPANHGPVRVRNISHFAYEDGTPYIPIGTTCYAWVHQGDKLEATDPRNPPQRAF